MVDTEVRNPYMWMSNQLYCSDLKYVYKSWRITWTTIIKLIIIVLAIMYPDSEGWRIEEEIKFSGILLNIVIVCKHFILISKFVCMWYKYIVCALLDCFLMDRGAYSFIFSHTYLP